jgi:plasmid stability protein
MGIIIHPELESMLRARAAAHGVSVEVYVERLVRADQKIEDELESLAMEGLNSGEPFEVPTGYWEQKHRRLDSRLKKSSSQ